MLERMWRKGNPHTLLVKTQTGAATMEKSMEISQKIKNTNTIPALPLLGIYPKNMKSTIQRHLCIPMLIAALFTIAKTWKHPKCPAKDEWIKNMSYVLYTMEYYSARKKKTRWSCLQQPGWTLRV